MTKTKRQLTAKEVNHLIKFDKYEFINSISDDIPVEYLTGFAEFYGRDFSVNKNVLIPRIETEQIIEIALEKVSKTKNNKVVFCDIGTGSGCIGITLIFELSQLNFNFEVYLSDISSEALQLASSNLNELLNDLVLKNSINVLQSNLFESYPENIKFDLIIANLPYIPSSRIQNLQNNVKNHEPFFALDGGELGLELIERLIEQSRNKLKRDGMIILEVDDTHITNSIAVIKVLKNFSEFEFKFIEDVNSKNRFWLLENKIEGLL